MSSNSDIQSAKPQHRKNAVAAAIRSKCVYKRTGKPSVPFCEKEGARKRAIVFLNKEKTEQSELCSDVVRLMRFERTTFRVGV